DLLVGLAVLPFSATWEVFKVWIFGDVWCRIWLAVDVWMCTASILNLCAISLDRYVAVTRPVTYPSIMSTKRAKSLIAGIWVLSFVICFPPLVGWKDQKPMAEPTYTRGNYTLYYATSTSDEEDGEYGGFDASGSGDSSSSASFSNANYETYSPEHITDDDYGSSTTTSSRSANSAITSTSTSTSRTTSKATKIPSTTYDYVDSLPLSSPLPPPPPPPLTPPPPCPWKCELTNDRGYVLYSALGSFYIPMFVMLFFYWRIYRAAVRTTRAINQGFKTTKGK
ncbi:octopamine receptor Oamb-like, partial [Musca vetustissima]|uniref:octopamine receptor Oamb-like n=1 Tax=Musca vetustissima TaxID=27455 RepID=UPI002AB74D5F